MNDNELREKAALALGRLEAQSDCPQCYGEGIRHDYDNIEAPDPPRPCECLDFPVLNWTTAGALLERAKHAKSAVRILVQYAVGQPHGSVTVDNDDPQSVSSRYRYRGDVTARNVIEACVLALGEKE